MEDNKSSAASGLMPFPLIHIWAEIRNIFV